MFKTYISVSESECHDIIDIMRSKELVSKYMNLNPGGTPYIRMIRMIIVLFGGCNRRFCIFRGFSSEIN